MAAPNAPAEPTMDMASQSPSPIARPRRRWLRAIALTLLCLVLLLASTVGGLWWWAGTDGSLAAALRYVAKSQPLMAERATGSMRAGGHVDRLVWQHDGLKVDARDVSLAWQPWALLHGTLKLDRLAVGSVQVDDQRTPSNTPSTPPSAVGLPLPVALDSFSIGQLQWNGTTAFTASGIAGQYAFNGLQHQLDLASLQVAGGDYKGRAVLTSVGPLRLDANLSGALTTAIPGSKTPLPLVFQASAQGLLTDLQVKADLQVEETAAANTGPVVPGTKAATPATPAAPQLRPQASVTARVMPWATQPLPQADAAFRDLDIGTLWPEAPQTRLTGTASVRPADAAIALANATWQLQLQLANALPGPWDKKRLPFEKLETQGEWRSAANAGTDTASAGTAMIRSLKAQLGGGELVASGEWASNPAPVPSTTPATAKPQTSPSPATALPAPTQAWQLKATLQHVNPARLHSQLAPLPLDGQATVQSAGAAIQFDAGVQTTDNIRSEAPAPKKAANANLLGQLRLRDAKTTGSWNAAQAGGTLALSALRVRTDDAELSGQLEVQPAARGGKGKLTLTAPGLDASLQGELRPASGSGDLAVHGRDAAQSLRWLQKLPGLQSPGSVIQTASTTGAIEISASWQGGWQDPAVQAKVDVASLDVRMTSPAPVPPASPASSPASTPTADAAATLPGPPGTLGTGVPAPAASVIKVRALQATLSGKLSQAQLSTQGRVEIGQRRYALQASAEGGSGTAGKAGLGSLPWQGLLKQLNLSVEDPALGPGAWRLATRGSVALKWTPGLANGLGGAFESGAGEAALIAPTAIATHAAAGATPTTFTAGTAGQALLSWQPVHWRPGEFITAGKLTGLPLAWIELVAGPQLAGAGLTGNLVFDAEWDARLSDTLSLKASVARSSGDITVQAETTQGTAARVAAGVREARVSLVSEGDGLTLSLRWNSERAGTADGELKTRLTRAPAGEGVGGWLWPATAPLTGQLRAQLPRIGVWSVLAPPGWRLRGSLGADIAISGTRGAPQLAGDLLANDLALRSVVDGIEFGNGRLRARLDGTRMRINEFTLQGAGDKGTGGVLAAQGEAGWVDGRPQVQLNAKLDKLKASIRTDRQLTVSGEVQASLQGQQTELAGKLVIDQARIILPDEGTPQLGDDVVVRTTSGAAAGQKAPEKTSAATADKSARPLKLGVQIDLGQDFRIQGKGIDTRVRGTLALSGDSLRDPRLNGTVNTFGGQYRAYGQRLDVETGMLRFTGAIDNPTLDILAVRPNLTQRVGVQITGTALLPRVRLYAQPELADSEKLSWLILGRSSASGGAEAALLQQAALALLGSKGGGMSGGLASSLGLDELSFRGSASNADGTTSDSAITLGKRFSRNFYAAYERSISGALGTLYIFYDLSQRFTVRAQAGDQSAVDLIFTVPYD